MLTIAIKIILGFFVFFVLYDLITKGKKHSKGMKIFIYLTCKFVGALIILFSALDLFHYFI